MSETCEHSPVSGCVAQCGLGTNWIAASTHGAHCRYSSSWLPNYKIIIRLRHKAHSTQHTGCPTALGPLCFLLFCQFLLYQNTKIWWVLKNSGNLLSDRHQNFKNLWRNSWDNWHQRWHLSFRSWHFTIPQGQKNNFGVVGGNFDVNYLSYF